MTKRRESDRDASADAQSFRAAMRDVRPLKTPAAEPVRMPPKPRRRVKAAVALDLDEHLPLINANVTAEQTLSFHKPGVRDQVLRHLRRGLYPVEAELDLHGLTQARARLLFAEFIETSRAERQRCVRIVHGKGLRSGSRGAILKSAINEWLRRHHDVMAFSSAKGIDGGTGAVYVLLRG
jgi:DNA-nicking Smr family endonuclease